MKNSLIFAIDSISTHFRKFVLSVLLVFMCSLLVLFALMAYHGQNLVYESCDHVLARGVKNTGIIQLMEDEFYNDKIEKYLEQLEKQEEIQVIGDCAEYIESAPALEPLWNIQEGKYGSQDMGETGLYIENVSSSASNLCEMKLSSGIPVEQLSFEKENVYYLYLGYGFCDIPIGTTYQVEGNIYEVAGILSSNQSWIKEELLTDFSSEIGNAAQSSDYMVFKIRNQEPPLSDYLWISSAEGYSIDEALDVADKLGEEWKIDIHYPSLQERYEVSQALRGINLKIEKGDFVGIVGSSGSGKSTLLHILGGMDSVTGGEYLFQGENIAAFSSRKLHEFRKRNISFVFQNFALMNQYTVYENVEMPLRARRKKNRKVQIMEQLEKMGIAHLKDKTPLQLSGGQQQRCAIARALVADTPIVLADEPTGALDQHTGNEIMNCFEEINSTGKTVILITHDLAIANRCKRIIQIEDGVIV